MIRLRNIFTKQRVRNICRDLTFQRHEFKQDCNTIHKITRRHFYLSACVGHARINHEHAALIKRHTKLSRDHMTPELALHLITKECALWNAKPDDSCPFPDPFWAFYWPGGQVLTRYILDTPGRFQDQVVLDVGSGCGASSIAAVMAGARHVIANDVDPFAACAIKLNATENRVAMEVVPDNLIGQLNDKWTTVLLGDMFYDLDFRDRLVDWLTHHTRMFKSNVFIGDPGRIPLLNDPITKRLTKVAEYDLPETCIEENNGLTKGYVWKMDSDFLHNVI